MPHPAFPIRMAVIGCGGISDAHLNGYCQLPQTFQVSASCDFAPENRAKRLEHGTASPSQFSDSREMFQQAGWPVRHDFEPVDPFKAELEHFADCLHAGNPPIHGVFEGRAVLDLLLAAAQSADGWQTT